MSKGSGVTVEENLSTGPNNANEHSQDIFRVKRASRMWVVSWQTLFLHGDLERTMVCANRFPQEQAFPSI